MFKEFYSLAREPFSKELKEADFFNAQSFSEALARLHYLKKVRGIGVLTGETGAGKTSALRCFAGNLNAALFKVVYFPLSTGTVMDFYRGLVKGLGLEPRFRKVDLFHQIQEGVYTLFKEKRITPVFILDEMHMASPKFLADLSIIFNFKMDSVNPFVLILAGMPHLLSSLTLNQNQSLNQRVLMRYKMEPLNQDEVKRYINHHLEIAGAKHTIFSEAAIEAISSRSRGWPRMINNIAVTSMLYGAQLQVENICPDVVKKAIEDIDTE